MRLHKSIVAVVIAPKWLNNFQGDFMFDVAGLDCILKKRETHYIENVSQQSRFANFVIVNFIARPWEPASDGMKFLSALLRGVSGFDRPIEICSAVPFSITGAWTRNANLWSSLRRSLEKWHVKQLPSSGRYYLTLQVHQYFHILIWDISGFSSYHY